MRHLRLLLFVVTASVSAAATFSWNGAAGDHQYNNPGNWVGGVVPPNNGTATVVFGDSQDTTVVLPLLLNVAQVRFQQSASTAYTLDTAFLTLLTIQDGVTTAPGAGASRIGHNITLNLVGHQSFDIASGNLEIAGAILGNGDLVKTGAGSLRVSGLNLLTGNTQVDAGTLVFANANAVPTLGSIASSAIGYVGAENSGALSALLGQVDNGSFHGVLGLETAAGQDSATVFSDRIDVSSLTNFSGIGTTTSAHITGEINVARGQNYRFGGGGGTLVVESNLTARDTNLRVNSAFGQPLTVVLRGNNTFSGSTSVLHSVLVLDSAQAISASAGALKLDGPGYIGATERFGRSTAGFLSMVNPSASSFAIVGFDSVDVNAPRTISDAIDLSVGGTRTNPYYLGTSSKVVLTGSITPTVGDSLYLTAVKGGHLVVGSTLGNNIPGLVVGQASSFDPQGGTVELTHQNTYTGGTQVLGGTLRVSNNAALGLGGVTVGDRATLDINHATVFSNPFSLAPGGRLSGHGTIATPGGSIIGPGAILSPGGAHGIGTLTFNSSLTLGPGAVVEFGLTSATGTPGTNWDLLNLSSGSLNLTATADAPVTLALSSLNAAGSIGPLNGFDANQSYSWLFASTGSVTGFSDDKFTFDTTGFGSSLAGGSFFVSQGNAGLSINFTPVPEPGTYVLLALGLGIVAVLELRRRRK